VSATVTATSFCRFCIAFCGINVDVAEGSATRVVGDVDHGLTSGYTCAMGRALPEQHRHPDRLVHSQRRGPNGFVPISSHDVIAEVAERLEEVIAKHGPESVAMYLGTYSVHYPAGYATANAFMKAIGSRMVFDCESIDQSGKRMAGAYHGYWSAGPHPFDTADSWMIVGANPLVSMWGGVPGFNPAQRLREAKRRGLQLVVIDPRRTETAVNAAVHLQPVPGEDPTVLAGLIRQIIADGLIDREFIDHEVEGFDELAAAVEPFTAEYVQRRAGIDPSDLVAAARVFASATRGSVTCGTGPNMAHRGTLTEYLAVCLHTICGRWLRNEEPIPNPKVWFPDREYRAEAKPRPSSIHGTGPTLRTRGLTHNPTRLPTAALAEEILTPGPGQIRALITVGGNPITGWPDTQRTEAALRDLELHVTIDPVMSASAKLAHYVIAPKLSLEVESINWLSEIYWEYGPTTTGAPEPYGQWTAAVVDPPDGSDLLEEWQFFAGLADRLGHTLRIKGTNLPDSKHLTIDDVHRAMTRGARVDYDTIKAFPRGNTFTDPDRRVLPKRPGVSERLCVAHPRMIGELRDVSTETFGTGGHRGDPTFTHRLISRRLDHVFNSSGRHLSRLARQHPNNPAWMHPDDLNALGVHEGALVDITTDRATVTAIAQPDETLKPGTVSMAAGWGGVADTPDTVTTDGVNINQLIDNTVDFDPITGQPVMSAIPIRLRAHVPHHPPPTLSIKGTP
jgi:anaerobic selenocysteine-containing dehydrogenase